MFYTFRQNNSGGKFEVNDSVKHYVIIEADNAEEANNIAGEKTDIYFNGVDKNIDCECCGDRWDEQDESDGTETPMIFGVDVFKYKDDLPIFKPEYIVYYKDGHTVTGKCYKGDRDL